MFGKRWNSTSVKRTVTNPVYIGRIVAGRKRRRGNFCSLYDEGGIVVENAHEPLVSVDLFERGQEQLEQSDKPCTSSRPGKYLLTGVIFLADRRRL